MRQQLGPAPSLPADAARYQDLPNVAILLATMFRLASVIDGGNPQDVYGGVYGLDFGVPSDVYASTIQSLDCADGRLVI